MPKYSLTNWMVNNVYSLVVYGLSPAVPKMLYLTQILKIGFRTES